MKSVFTKKHLNKLFPFHIMIKEDLAIVQGGKLLNKLVPGDLKGQLLTDHFIIQGITGKLSFDTFRKSCDKLICLKSIKGSVVLNGAFYESASSEHLIFIGNIQPDHLLRHYKNKITLKDFPVYDSFNDFLFSYRTNTKAQEELGVLLRNSRKQLEEIKVLNHDLRQSETSYRTLLENMNEGLLQVDNNETIEYVNDQFCELVGYTREELIGQNAVALLSISEEEGKKMEKKVNERRKGVSDRYEIRIRKKTGELIWLSVSGAPVLDARGKVIGSIGINTDITSPKEVFNALQESEGRYRNFISNSREGIWRLEYDPPLKIGISPGKLAKQLLYEGAIMECNDVMAKMYGYKKGEELYGKRLIDLFSPEKKEEKITAIERAKTFIKNDFKANESISKEKDKNGNVIYISNSTSAEIQDGYLFRLWGMQRNVTDRILAEEALTQSEMRYRRLFEKMNEGLLFSNPEGLITMVNPSFCKMVGYSKDNLIGANGHQLFHDKHEIPRLRKKSAQREAGQSERYELEFITKSRKRILVQISASPHYAPNGDFVGVMCITSDITEKKKAEMAMRDSEHKYRSIFEQSYQAVYDFDPKTKLVLQANESFKKYLDYEESDLKNLKMYDFINHDRSSIDDYVDHILDKRTIDLGEREWKNKNGEIINVMVMGSLISQEGKEFVNIVAQDITTRKRAEARKELSYNIAQAAMTSSEDFDQFSMYVHKKLNSYMGAEICHLTLYDRSKGVLNTVCVRDSVKLEVLNYQRPFGNGLQECTIAMAKPLLLRNSESEEFTQKTGYDATIHDEDRDLKVLLLVPLLSETAAVGVITIASIKNENALVHEDIELMEFVATQIVSVLDRQKVHAEVKKAERTIEHSMNGVLTSDLEGNLVYANPAAVEMWGYQDALTMMTYKTHILDYHPLDTHPRVFDILRTIRKEGRYFDINGLKCARKDGTSFIAQVGGSSVKSEKGENIGITMSFIDITEQKKTEKDYNTLLDTMNDGVIQVDNDENIQYVNQQFCTLVGYTKEELINQNANRLLSVDEKASKAMKKKATKRTRGIVETYETKLRRKNGEIIWVSTSAAPVLDEHGTIIGSVGITRNIMQRKKDEKRLESLSRFPGENPFPVLRYSIEDQSFIYNNSAGEALIKFFKLKKNKTVKMHWEELINSAFKNKTTITDELSVKGKIYTCIIVPIPELNYVNVYANDITERKELEDKMTWQFMKLEKYAFVTSHQLRRPIATILGLVNIFDYENPDAAFNMEVLEKFKIAAQEMDAVTRETVELLVADEFLDEE